MSRKYELETIPIWDAYDQNSECPLCILAERAENHYVEFYLGNSVMVPETRVEINQTGFCPQHFSRLYHGSKDKQPLGLVTHTHYLEYNSALSKRRKRLQTAAKLGAGRIKRMATSYAEYLRIKEQSCMICGRLAYTLDRYSYTIVYLWHKKEDFAETFRSSKGFCFHHLPNILDMAVDLLGIAAFNRFLTDLLPIQAQTASTLEEDLLWYTKKFDYQNDDKPWGNARDALKRALQKLAGIVIKD